METHFEQPNPYQLPKPPATPLTKEDWRPGKETWEQIVFGREIFFRHPNFWQVLTGHRAVFSKTDLDRFFDDEGNLQLPKSELEWYGHERKFHPKTQTYTLTPF